MRLTNKLVHDIKKILLHYGPESQKEKAMEELIELKNELFSDVYGSHSELSDIKQEVADVYVMLEQIKMIYRFTDTEVVEIMRSKVDRQLRRMEKQ